MEKRFIPFSEIGKQDCIVVDALHPKALVLSHWKGANIHPSIEDDTSAEIALNAMKTNFPGTEAKLVSANHFDIDGFVGVFACCYPYFAREHEDVLRAMARIGDFRELQPGQEHSMHAAEICCWMNEVEKDQFYRPFGEKDEMKLCAEKFNYFLDVFPEVLLNPSNFFDGWGEEMEYLQDSLALLSEAKIELESDINLRIVEVREPIHYYALFSNSYFSDMILSIYSENRYEFEFKYNSWVDIASRGTMPRLNLEALTEELNHIETSQYSWQADKITDTGPILRLEDETLISKADRYDQPYNRPIYSSSIPPEQFKKIVVGYLKKHYSNVRPKLRWTWDEMRAFNRSQFPKK